MATGDVAHPYSEDQQGAGRGADIDVELRGNCPRRSNPHDLGVANVTKITQYVVDRRSDPEL